MTVSSHKPDRPWDQNEHGLWCPACGDLIAPSWFLDDDDYQSPETCKQCGFPDFEGGPGHFMEKIG